MRHLAEGAAWSLGGGVLWIGIREGCRADPLIVIVPFCVAAVLAALVYFVAWVGSLP